MRSTKLAHSVIIQMKAIEQYFCAGAVYYDVQGGTSF